jgi:DNA-binding MarR family transcriptional regulator/GNAT superfamily N-acetyltransferase
MIDDGSEARVAAVRQFNRFYTHKIGVLQEGLLGSPFTLTESRLLYELAHRQSPTASLLGRALNLDPGYLSRMLRSFEERGLIERRPSLRDGRQSLIGLTEAGRAAFAPLDRRSREEIGALLAALPRSVQTRLVAAMRTVERLLGSPEAERRPYLLRPPRPGDIGWVVARHGALYAEEYGWNEEFEALVADIAAKFLRDFEPRREACWIAEQDGENVGSAFLVAQSEEIAQLRLLLVEPAARGQGIGARLVAECIGFARQKGYRRVALWTNSVLTAARRLYQRAGFARVASGPHKSFGQDLIGESWELRL